MAQEDRQDMGLLRDVDKSTKKIKKGSESGYFNRKKNWTDEEIHKLFTDIIRTEREKGT